MGKIRVFRLTDAADDENTEFIDFNVPGTEDKTTVENAFITSIKENDTDGVGNNQGVELELGNQQALNKIEDIITLEGFISKRNGDSDDGMNAFLITLRLWASDDKINTAWKQGRFGLIVDDNKTQDVFPDRTPPDKLGLLWVRLDWTTDFKGNRELFTWVFRVNKGGPT